MCTMQKKRCRQKGEIPLSRRPLALDTKGRILVEGHWLLMQISDPRFSSPVRVALELVLALVLVLTLTLALAVRLRLLLGVV